MCLQHKAGVGNVETGGRWVHAIFSSLSPSFLFFQVHPSMVVRIWREKGQELRVAGIYELRVQHAFGEGEGKRAPFAKTIFNFFKRQLQSHD